MPDLSYRATLKPLAVEELVDLAVHRPLAYVIARAAYPTPVTPDQITWASMIVGILAGAAAWSSFALGAPRLAAAGALFIASAVLDCADGQLARMRGTSSPLGRMLDGAVDAVVQIAFVPAVVAHLWWKHGGPSPAPPPPGVERAWVDALLWLAVSVPAVLTGLAHTILYDRYKNVYLHHTDPRRKEGEDPEDIDAALGAGAPGGLGAWLRRSMSAPYLKRQQALLGRLDPWVPARFRDMPGYSPEAASRYRASQRGLMRAWTFYGIGTHIFGLGVAAALDRVELYVLTRLVLFNAALLWLVPAQRRASRAFFGATP